jgi:pimeloyl-ACP methyl ester carboxylesterase
MPMENNGGNGNLSNILQEDYEGLRMHFLEGDSDKPTVVYAKGLSYPSHAFQWMHMFNACGMGAVFAPYRGSWGSEGSFLSEAGDVLSPEQDVADMVAFADLLNPDSYVIIAGNCFGASPALVAGAQDDSVSKIMTWGGMIYSDDVSSNIRYSTLTYESQPGIDHLVDKCIDLGRNLKDGGIEGEEYFDTYNGFSHDVWEKMINGGTSLNPYRHLSELADKDVLLFAPKEDHLIHPQRSHDFTEALKHYNGNVTLHEPEGGHKTGFGEQEMVQTLTWMLGKSPEEMAGGFQTIAGFGNYAQEVSFDGKTVTVPFYELNREQLQGFKDERLVHDKPLEELFTMIY